MIKSTVEAKKKLMTKTEGLNLYFAGLPSFKRNFSRDCIISAMIMQDAEMLLSQLKFCILRQGKKSNANNGEEYGKIHHEYPGVILNGLSTEYNACDTTALFIIGMREYIKISGDKSFFQNNRTAIESAVKYIISHTSSGIFLEDTSQCGAEKFALDSTYWKDAQFINGKKPKYPVLYPLAHIQNACAIKSAADMLQSDELLKISLHMKKRYLEFFHLCAKDADSEIAAISSDMLQALFFIKPEDIDENFKEKIISASKKLETPFGYHTLYPKFPFILIEDSYDYPNTVWPFEQALIHIGAQKHGMTEIMNVAKRVNEFIITFPEYILLKKDKAINAGCNPQLWTIAAKEYFERT